MLAPSRTLRDSTSCSEPIRLENLEKGSAKCGQNLPERVISYVELQRILLVGFNTVWTRDGGLQLGMLPGRGLIPREHVVTNLDVLVKHPQASIIRYPIQGLRSL
jgi:hypothetical protein